MWKSTCEFTNQRQLFNGESDHFKKLLYVNNVLCAKRKGKRKKSLNDFKKKKFAKIVLSRGIKSSGRRYFIFWYDIEATAIHPSTLRERKKTLYYCGRWIDLSPFLGWEFHKYWKYLSTATSSSSIWKRRLCVCVLNRIVWVLYWIYYMTLTVQFPEWLTSHCKVS